MITAEMHGGPRDGHTRQMSDSVVMWSVVDDGPPIRSGHYIRLYREGATGYYRFTWQGWDPPAVQDWPLAGLGE